MDLPSIHDFAGDRTAPHVEVLGATNFDFAQMIEAAGARSVVEALTDHLQVDAATMRESIAHSGPLFIHAYQLWMDRPGGPDELNELARSGGPQQFADRPGLVKASVSRQEGQVYLKHLFPNDEERDRLTQQMAEHLGIDSKKLETMMPSLAALFIGVLCKSIAA